MKKIVYNRIYPLKKFGQNFLYDKIIIQKIINIINPKYSDTLIEIGPGTGSLTKPMSNFVKRLIVLEIDKRMISYLYKTEYFKKLKIFFVDAVKFNFKNLYIKLHKSSLRIFGNLPYYISVIFLLKTVEWYYCIKDMHFMFQKEVADRIVAIPNTKKYGRLSVIMQSIYKINRLFEIDKFNFTPVPKVNSSFLYFKPFREKVGSNFKYIKKLSYITNLAFSCRRKILKNSLSKLFNARQLLNLNIDPLLRAENVSVEQYWKLVKNLKIVF